MEQVCSNCCQDLDLPLRHLLMPEVFLDEAGLAFMRVHGLLDQEFRKNGMVEFKMNDHVYKIRFLHLAFPDAYLDGEGQAFFQQHGIFDAIVRNVTVKILHRCAKLLGSGLCSIYEQRPQICRDFDCATRQDCTRDERVFPATLHRVAHA
jgi:Fe-S-cluster containining protein